MPESFVIPLRVPGLVKADFAMRLYLDGARQSGSEAAVTVTELGGAGDYLVDGLPDADSGEWWGSRNRPAPRSTAPGRRATSAPAQPATPPCAAATGTTSGALVFPTLLPCAPKTLSTLTHGLTLQLSLSRLDASTPR